MLLPFLLLLLGTASAAVLAYGTDSRWGSFHHGISFILEARRLQWPLVTLTLLLCVTLLVLVVSARKRAWWLIGLLPVLALLAHRFLTRADLRRQPVEDPPLVEAASAALLTTGDFVIGVHFAGNALAFPYSQMYRAPAVLLRDRQQRMILMWSPAANKATAFTLGRELHARDLETVSFPAGALLLYDGRSGTFINGITGQTSDHAKPVSFRDPLPVEKQSWGEWQSHNPATRVMDLPGTLPGSPARYDVTAHPPAGARSDEKLALIFAPTPLAISPDDLSDAPVNLSAPDGTAVLVLRDPATARLRAFDRHLDGDLSPRFAAISDSKQPTAVMIDRDTSTEWSADAVPATAPGSPAPHAKPLVELPVETDLPWETMKFWFPQLQRVDRTQIAAGVEPAQVSAPPPSKRSATGTPRRRRRRRSAAP